MTVHDSTVQLDKRGRAVIAIQNNTGVMERLDEGSALGEVPVVLEVVPSVQSDSGVGAVVGQVRSGNNHEDTELQ